MVFCCSVKMFYIVPLTEEISDIRNWIKNIEQHASDNVNKILVGNKADMDESKRVKKLFASQKMLNMAQLPSLTIPIPFFLPPQAVTTAQGQALANEYRLNFFETVSF